MHNPFDIKYPVTFDNYADLANFFSLGSSKELHTSASLKGNSLKMVKNFLDKNFIYLKTGRKMTLLSRKSADTIAPKPISVHSTLQGRVFDTYKDLCLFLNEPVKNGGARTNQIANWQQYFQLTKEGRTYKVGEVATPLKGIPERVRKTRSDTVWHENISIQLYYSLHALSTSTIPNKYGVNNLVLSTQEAYEEVGLTNSSFRELFWNSNEKEKTSKQIFAQAASDKFYFILYNVLRSLHSRHILCVTDTFAVHFSEGSKYMRLATTAEHEKIHLAMRPLLTNKFALKSGKVGNAFNINLRGLNKDFYSALRDKLREEGIYFGYKVHSIAFTESSISGLHKYLCSSADAQLAKGNINEESYRMLLRMLKTDVQFTSIPTQEDSRTFDDLSKGIEPNTAIYFELLEQTIPLTEKVLAE
jgi:hypothetical protein